MDPVRYAFKLTASAQHVVSDFADAKTVASRRVTYPPPPPMPMPHPGRSTIGAVSRMGVACLAGSATATGVAAALAPLLARGWTGAVVLVAVAALADLVIYGVVLLLLGVDGAQSRHQDRALPQAW